MGGGIMNARPRQQFIFGGVADTVKDLGKKAVKGIKDIASSDVGKAAIIAAGVYKLGGGQFGKLFSGGPTGFEFGNLPGASLFAGSAGAAASTEATKPFLSTKLGKFAALGGLSAFLTSQFGLTKEQQAEQLKDPTTLKNYLRLYYKNLNPKAQEEDVEEFVETNAAEYTAGMGAYAVGGRVGFAEGPVLPPDPTQPVNPFGPKPGDFGIEEDIPIKTASYGYDEAMSDTYDSYLEMKRKGLIPPTMEFDEFLQEVVPEMGSKRIEETRGVAALGGRMGFDEGTKNPSTTEQRLMSLTDETIDIPMEDTQGAPSILDKFDDEEMVIIIETGPDGKPKLVPVPKSQVMPKGILGSGRTMKAKGDTASMNAMQAAGIEGLPIRQNQAGVKELDLRETGGFIQPVGIKEKEDDIPAMLSNNEFVMTADAVRGMGGGDVNLGAQRMYDQMKMLEAGGKV